MTCLFGDFFPIPPHLGSQNPKRTQFWGVNRRFQAKLAKSKNVHIIKTTVKEMGLYPCRKYLFYKFHNNRLTNVVANGYRHSLPASLRASMILNIHAAPAAIDDLRRSESQRSLHELASRLWVICPHALNESCALIGWQNLYKRDRTAAAFTLSLIISAMLSDVKHQ